MSADVSPAPLPARTRGRGGARRLRADALLSSSPATLLVVFFFGAPLVMFVIESLLTDRGFTKATKPFTFENYTDFLTSSINRTLAWNSVVVGVMTALVSVVLGVALAHWLRYRAGRWAMPVLAAVIATVFASYLVRVYAWRTMLGTNGVINSGLESIGLIDRPLEFILFNRTAVVIAETQIYLPLIVLMLFGGFRPLEPGYLEAARDLGYNSFRVWTRVILPLMAKPITMAFLVAFLFASSDWLAPSFLGGPTNVLLAVQASQAFQVNGTWATGAALCIVMAVAYVVLFALATVVLRIAKLDKVKWSS